MWIWMFYFHCWKMKCKQYTAEKSCPKTPTKLNIQHTKCWLIKILSQFIITAGISHSKIEYDSTISRCSPHCLKLCDTVGKTITNFSSEYGNVFCNVFKKKKIHCFCVIDVFIGNTHSSQTFLRTYHTSPVVAIICDSGWWEEDKMTHLMMH